MFDVRDIRGDDIDLDYAEIRRYWEPVVEITQIKETQRPTRVIARRR